MEFVGDAFALARSGKPVFGIFIADLVVIDEPAGVTNQLPSRIMKRDRDAILHHPFSAEAQPEMFNRLWTESPGGQIRVLWIKMLQFEIQRSIHESFLAWLCQIGHRLFRHLRLFT